MSVMYYYNNILIHLHTSLGVGTESVKFKSSRSFFELFEQTIRDDYWVKSRINIFKLCISFMSLLFINPSFS